MNPGHPACKVAGGVSQGFCECLRMPGECRLGTAFSLWQALPSSAHSYPLFWRYYTATTPRYTASRWCPTRLETGRMETENRPGGSGPTLRVWPLQSTPEYQGCQLTQRQLKHRTYYDAECRMALLNATIKMYPDTLIYLKEFAILLPDIAEEILGGFKLLGSV